MNADKLLKISLVLELDAHLRQELLIDLDQRASIGHDPKANVISWSKLPRKLELISPSLTAPHVIIPLDYPARAVDAAGCEPSLELTHSSQGAPLTFPLELGKRVTIELPGARLHVELIDLGQELHLKIPRAERRVQPPGLDRRALAGLAAALLVSLGAGYFYTPQEHSFSSPLAPADVAAVTQDASFEDFVAAVQGDDVIQRGSSPEARRSNDKVRTPPPRRVAVMNTRQPANMQADAPKHDDLEHAHRDVMIDAAARVRRETTPEPFNLIGVDETLKRNHHLFRACYDSSLESSAEQRRGRLDISFDITASGSVASASNFRRGTNEVGDELARCIERVLTRIDFPTEDTPGAGNISLVFASDD